MWDFDRAFGNVNPNRNENYLRASDPTGLYAADKHFYAYLLKYEEFHLKVAEIYKEYYQPIEDIYSENGQIDRITNQYETVFNRNFTDAGWDVSKVYNVYVRMPDATYQKNIEFLRNWLYNRNQWMANYYGIDTHSVEGDVNADGYFNVSDMILLQKWLLAVPGTELMNNEAADLYQDEIIDAFDLAILKRMLINEQDH